MYRDNTLIPTEAVRLLALGILASGDCSYADLASEVRHFTGRIVGPSLDLVGTPLEVLRIEGLIELKNRKNPQAVSKDDDLLHITDSGRQELTRLLSANLRPPVDGLNRMIVALKVRFLHLLDPKDQELQAGILAEMCQRELARLSDLREHMKDAGEGHLGSWLDHEIAQTESRLAWFENLRASLA